MVIQFGTGVLFAKPTTLGNLPTNPSPFTFGLLQEATVDFKGDLKKLFGQFQFPAATARGKIEVTIKAKLAVFDPNMLNQLYFAQTAAAGYNLVVYGEQHTANVTNNTFSATHSPIVDDWGVTDANTGQSFINVPNTASLTASGQYVINTTSGLYTLYGADTVAGRTVSISYTYNVPGSGTTITLANQLMGYAPELAMLLYNSFRGKYFAVKLNCVTLGGISIPTKLEDFWIMDIDGAANVDNSNNLGQLMMDNS